MFAALTEAYSHAVPKLDGSSPSASSNVDWVGLTAAVVQDFGVPLAKATAKAGSELSRGAAREAVPFFRSVVSTANRVVSGVVFGGKSFSEAAAAAGIDEKAFKAKLEADKKALILQIKVTDEKALKADAAFQALAAAEAAFATSIKAAGSLQRKLGLASEEAQGLAKEVNEAEGRLLVQSGGAPLRSMVAAGEAGKEYGKGLAGVLFQEDTVRRKLADVWKGVREVTDGGGGGRGGDKERCWGV